MLSKIGKIYFFIEIPQGQFSTILKRSACSQFDFFQYKGTDPEQLTKIRTISIYKVYLSHSEN